jgi:hypothetical protein
MQYFGPDLVMNMNNDSWSFRGLSEVHARPKSAVLTLDFEGLGNGFESSVQVAALFTVLPADDAAADARCRIPTNTLFHPFICKAR